MKIFPQRTKFYKGNIFIKKVACFAGVLSAVFLADSLEMALRQSPTHPKAKESTPKVVE